VRASALCLAVVSAALLASARPASACDSSSCAILTRGGLGTLPKGAFSVDFSFRYTDEGKRLAGSSSTEDVVLPRIDFDGQRLLPGFHRETDGSTSGMQADVAYGLTSRLSAFASLPLFTRKRYVHTHVLGSHTPPAPTEPVDPNDPHGHGPAPEEAPTPLAYTSDGFGDTQLGVRYALWGGASQRLSAGFAVKLPTGESELPNPFDGGLHDPTLQPGTGSLDYILSAQYARGALPVQWAASASRQFTTANELHYRFGDETILGLGVTRTLRAVYSRAQVAASVQVKAHFRGRSVYLDAPVPSTGSRMVILAPGLRVTTPGGLGFYAYLQVPLYRHVNDVQLAMRSALLTGVSKAF
jgi:outer membrane putative beta-barrel porin/alpha-amylase